MKNAGLLNRFAGIIGYPEEVPSEALAFVFRVDDLLLQASVVGRSVVLRCDLGVSESSVVTFAEYAAGRFLREDATLAWDGVSEMLYVWCGFDVDGDKDVLRNGFSAFADACEWWLARVGEVDTPVSAFPDILIRP